MCDCLLSFLSKTKPQTKRIMKTKTKETLTNLILALAMGAAIGLMFFYGIPA